MVLYLCNHNLTVPIIFMIYLRIIQIIQPVSGSPHCSLYKQYPSLLIFIIINPLDPNSDQHQISPHHISA